VGTPIGNLEDITLRALRILREVHLIAAEDTRTARKLLGHYGIGTPVTSYFEHNKLTKLDTILNTLAQGDVALISEAGMPGISDPGYELICAALERGISVVPIPGATALITAIAVSGLPTDTFLYAGFLPRRRAERRRVLGELASQTATLVVFEAPHRVVDALEDMLAILGDRRMAAARELTKMFEDIRRGTISDVLAHFRAVAPRGEFTLVIEGSEKQESRREAVSQEQVRRRLDELQSQGLSLAQAAKAVAGEFGLARREVYDMARGSRADRP